MTFEVHSFRALTNSLNNGYACVCFTLTDSFVYLTFPLCSLLFILCPNESNLTDGFFAEISRDGPLSGEFQSRKKSPPGSVSTQQRTGPLLSDVVAMVHVLTDP